MKVVEELLSKRWIIKRDNENNYYQVKDEAKEMRRFFQDKFGYNLIINQHLIKLEKIPGKTEPWMGITDFLSIEEYQMFCFVLMYLEDKESEEQFILSSLTEYIQTQVEEENFSWTNFSTRKQLIRVIHYCLDKGIIKKTDGDEERFSRDESAEVLYENIGVSRYFMRNFARDLMEFTKPADFKQSEWIEMDEDRGIIRRQRVYRRLLLSPGIYRQEGDDEDFDYIRNYRNQISNDFQNIAPYSLHLHYGSAFMVLEAEAQFGKLFPSNNGISDLILVIHQYLNQCSFEKDACEVVKMTHKECKNIVNKAIKENFIYLSKTNQAKGYEILTKDSITLLIVFGFIKEEGEDMLIYPLVRKIEGRYRGEQGYDDGNK